jgi:translation elongation factor aEF-1 beta
MDRVIATIKLYPEDVIIGVNAVKEAVVKALPKDVEVYKFVEEPIAYGLVALIAHLILPETEGQLDKVENILKGVKGVGQLEVQMIRRI